jgi:ABC-type xylose transport system permease subunit
MNLVERVKAPTPKFFRVLRTIGLSLVAASGVLLTAPISLPAAVITLAGYLTVAGTVMSAVSQTAVQDPDDAEAALDDGSAY